MAGAARTARTNRNVSKLSSARTAHGAPTVPPLSGNVLISLPLLQVGFVSPLFVVLLECGTLGPDRMLSVFRCPTRLDDRFLVRTRTCPSGKETYVARVEMSDAATAKHDIVLLFICGVKKHDIVLRSRITMLTCCATSFLLNKNDTRLSTHVRAPLPIQKRVHIGARRVSSYDIYIGMVSNLHVLTKIFILLLLKRPRSLHFIHVYIEPYTINLDRARTRGSPWPGKMALG